MNIFYKNKIFLFFILFPFLGCVKDNITNKFDYNVVKRADLTNLLLFDYGPNILGVDTTDFTVKAQIRIDDMSFGGVAKLPNGGAAFTYTRRASNDGWGNLLYVTDKNCNLLNKYKICDSPLGPKVINNLLMVGGSEIVTGVKFKFQIYNTDNFKLLKEYLFQGMVDSWQITEWNNEAYFGVHPDGTPKNGYVVQLDLNSLDTTMILNNDTSLFDASSTVFRQDSILYIFKMLEKKIFIYDLNSKTVKLTAKVADYPEVAKLNADRLIFPYFKDGYLYGFFEKNDYSGAQISYWAKFNASTLALISLKQLNTPYKSSYNEFYAGSYYVIQFYDQVVFVDIETGVVVKTVSFNVKYY